MRKASQADSTDGGDQMDEDEFFNTWTRLQSAKALYLYIYISFINRKGSRLDNSATHHHLLSKISAERDNKTEQMFPDLSRRAKQPYRSSCRPASGI